MSGKGLSEAEAPGGESFADVQRRCRQFVDKSLAELPDSAAVLVFSHGITLRVLTNVLLRRPAGDVNRLNWMEHTAVTEIACDMQNGGARPVRINDYTHLKELCTADFARWGIVCRCRILNCPGERAADTDTGGKAYGTEDQGKKP